MVELTDEDIVFIEKYAGKEHIINENLTRQELKIKTKLEKLKLVTPNTNVLSFSIDLHEYNKYLSQKMVVGSYLDWSRRLNEMKAERAIDKKSQKLDKILHWTAWACTTVIAIGGLTVAIMSLFL